MHFPKPSQITLAKQLGFKWDGALPYPQWRQSPPAESKISLIIEITSIAFMCPTANAAKDGPKIFDILL